MTDFAEKGMADAHGWWTPNLPGSSRGCPPRCAVYRGALPGGPLRDKRGHSERLDEACGPHLLRAAQDALHSLRALEPSWALESGLRGLSQCWRRASPRADRRPACEGAPACRQAAQNGALAPCLGAPGAGSPRPSRLAVTAPAPPDPAPDGRAAPGSARPWPRPSGRARPVSRDGPTANSRPPMRLSSTSPALALNA